MDRILTVREPFASALVHGVKKAEYRSWKIPAGTRVWIHSGLQPGVPFVDLAQWLRDNGDATAGEYIDWTASNEDTKRPDLSRSPLAQAIYSAKGLQGSFEFPFGSIVGWCIFGESAPTTGEECKLGKFANPVEQFHALDPKAWKRHKGSLGLMPFGGI